MVYLNSFRLVVLTTLFYEQMHLARGQLWTRALHNNDQDHSSLGREEKNGRLLETLLNKDQPLSELFHIIQYGSPPSYYSQKTGSDSELYSQEDHYLLPKKTSNKHFLKEKELLAKVLDGLHYLAPAEESLRDSCGRSGSCSKAAKRACYRACKRAMKGTCSSYVCKSGMKSDFKKNCKSCCKSEFS